MLAKSLICSSGTTFRSESTFLQLTEAGSDAGILLACSSRKQLSVLEGDCSRENHNLSTYQQCYLIGRMSPVVVLVKTRTAMWSTTMTQIRATRQDIA
jgi:hypothetical protein